MQLTLLNSYEDTLMHLGSIVGDRVNTEQGSVALSAAMLLDLKAQVRTA